MHIILIILITRLHTVFRNTWFFSLMQVWSSLYVFLQRQIHQQLLRTKHLKEMHIKMSQAINLLIVKENDVRLQVKLPCSYCFVRALSTYLLRYLSSITVWWLKIVNNHRKQLNPPVFHRLLGTHLIPAGPLKREIHWSLVHSNLDEENYSVSKQKPFIESKGVSFTVTVCHVKSQGIKIKTPWIFLRQNATQSIDLNQKSNDFVTILATYSAVLCALNNLQRALP